MPTRKMAALAPGKCLICGTGLEGQVFDCPACATPHHSGCWQWTGGCAVYGCSRRPRPVREPQREEELLRVAAAAERQRRQPLPRPVTRPSHAPFGVIDEAYEVPTGPAVTVCLHLLLAVLLAVTGAGLSASHRAERAHDQRPSYRSMATQLATRWANERREVRTSLELGAEQILRDDSLWEGTGTEPVTALRRMMVMQEGEGLRSGMRQLARRDLPGWVRARLDVLLAVDRDGIPPSALVLWRP